MKKKINNINHLSFMKDFNIETSYILGILWADGSLYYNMISLEMAEDDLKEIKHLFLSNGEWNIRSRKRKGWKPQMVFHLSNEKFSSFLKENDYEYKSFKSPNKILSLLPEKLKYIWFRGYWDGDGCFYFNENRKLFQCTATSTYEQDWNFLISLFEELNIKYNIRRIKNKNSYSQIRITNKKDIKNFINYLYQDFPDIGFSRKTNKALLMLEKILYEKNKN